jgi:hypothetical protein
MWTWTLNWGEITPHIVVGTCPMKPDDLQRIQSDLQVTAVLSLQHDDCLAYWGIDYPAMCLVAEQFGLEMRRCPIRDFDVPDMRRKLPQAVSSLAQLLDSGHRTYVHCTAGLGRAPLVVLAYLILVENNPAETAIERIRNGRPGAVPAWEAFTGACRDMENRCRHEIKQRAYDLFQAGVYGDALADWNRAKSEVLKTALMGLASGIAAIKRPLESRQHENKP